MTFENIGDRAVPIETFDPRSQQNGHGGGVVYMMLVGRSCYREVLEQLGAQHRDRIEVFDGNCDEHCAWCGGDDD
jgi:hypothetical protein